MRRLLDLLEGYNLGNAKEEDVCLWSLNPEKGFSVKSCMIAFVPRTFIFFPYDMIWDSILSSKVFIFSMRILVEPGSHDRQFDQKRHNHPKSLLYVQSGWENYWSSLFSLPGSGHGVGFFFSSAYQLFGCSLSL